eukprot:180079-Chlamydomonas_euryale.AAC.6
MRVSEETSVRPRKPHCLEQATNKHAATLMAYKLSSKEQARGSTHSMQFSEQGTSTLPCP